MMKAEIPFTGGFGSCMILQGSLKLSQILWSFTHVKLGSTTSTTLGPSFSISMSDGHEYSSKQPVGTLIIKKLRSKPSEPDIQGKSVMLLDLLQITGMHYIPRFLNVDSTTASSAQSFFNSM